MIDDLPLQGKKILVRVDFNVPLDEKRQITDDTRIQASLPTIKYILEKGGSVILMSHLGRPKGEKKPALSLKPCAIRLSDLLDKEVKMAPDCVGKKVEKLVNSMEMGDVLLLENLRFHPAEERPEEDPTFAKQLAQLGDIYINDAFGTAHRAHSSTTAITEFFQGKAAAGFLLQKEIEFLGNYFRNPRHPFYAIIGGSKISTKMGVLQSLLKKVDALFIGGGMAYTFLKAQGYSIGKSLFEKELLPTASDFLDQAKKQKKPVFLPQDLVISKDFSNESEKKVIEIHQNIPDDWQGMDIGPMTLNQWKNTLQNGKMIFWNGPVGVFEFPNFAKGTHFIARTLAELHAITIVGGGDSIAAINQLKLFEKFSHISTGGGACLEYIEHGELPALKALH